MRVIRYRGQQISEDRVPSPPKVHEDRIPAVIQDAPFPELLSQLWYSDAEVIQTTEPVVSADMDIDLNQEVTD